MSADHSQQLHASNVSYDIEAQLEARTKDPLWFLARQWQMGEFEAENGGLPMQVQVKGAAYRITTAHIAGTPETVNTHQPLEALIEDEAANRTPPSWNTQALEYKFALSTPAHRLEADAYDGRDLDWHDFTLTETGKGKSQPVLIRMSPGRLQIDGVPETRFWTIEDRDAYFDTGQSAEPNILSVLLPEFFYTDIDNWYLIPAPMPSGSLREIDEVVVVDSFGIATRIEPVGNRAEDDPFSVFSIDTDTGAPSDASRLLALNTAARVGENDLIEEVRFLRDESANLVWAWERQFTDATGALITTALEPRDEQGPDSPAATAPEATLRFRLKSETARSFIPYVPRQTADVPAVDGEIALRRARADEEWSRDNPQYRGQFVAESPYLNEEDVPPSGLRVRRMNRFARGSDDQVYFWVGRDKDVAQSTRKPRLSFDDLLKATPKKTTVKKT